jgi:hypothetical protein
VGDDFLRGFAEVPPSDKVKYYRSNVSNHMHWPAEYQYLDGLKEPTLFKYLLESLGTTINEMAIFILDTKDEDNRSEVDKYILELYNSNMKTGNYMPTSDDLNFTDTVKDLFTDYEEIGPEVHLKGKDNAAVMTFKEMYEVTRKYPIEKIDTSEGVKLGEFLTLVDSLEHKELLSNTKYEPWKVVYLLLSPSYCATLPNSLQAFYNLNTLCHIAQRMRKYLDDKHPTLIDQELRRKHVEGEPLNELEAARPKLDVFVVGGNVQEEIENHFQEELTVVKKLSCACTFEVTLKRNQSLPSLYKKLQVAFLAVQNTSFIDLSSHAAFGKVLPRRVVKYLQEFHINDVESFRRLVFGNNDDHDCTFLENAPINEYSEFERTLIVTNPQGAKLLRYIAIILLYLPSEVLNLGEMPQNIRAVYEFILLLTYNHNNLYMKRTKKDEDGTFHGLLKNMLNYLCYWVLKGHNELITPFFELMERFENGAMFNSHKQVEEMLDYQSFLLHGIVIADKNTDLLNQREALEIISELLKQDYFDPVWYPKFAKKMGSWDPNEVYDLFSIGGIKDLECFQTKFKNDEFNNDKEDYVTFISEFKFPKEEDAKAFFETMDQHLDLDVVREAYNIHFKRSLDTGAIEISLEAWDKFMSSKTQTEFHHDSLNFRGNNNIKKEKGQGRIDYGTSGFNVSQISSTDLSYTITNSAGLNLNIKQSTGSKRYKGTDISSILSDALRNKHQATNMRVKRKYNKFFARQNNQDNGDESPKINISKYTAIYEDYWSTIDNFIDCLDTNELSKILSAHKLFTNCTPDAFNDKDSLSLLKLEVLKEKAIILNDMDRYPDLFFPERYKDQIQADLEKIPVEDEAFDKDRNEKLDELIYLFYSKANRNPKPKESFLQDLSLYNAIKTSYLKTPEYREFADEIQENRERTEKKRQSKRNTWNFFSNMK